MRYKSKPIDNKEKFLIVTFANKDYIEKTKQLFLSLLLNGGWQHDCMIIVEEISEEQRSWFIQRNIQVRLYRPQENIASKWFDSVHQLGFQLFSPYFLRWRKVICLDADIIIRGTLEPLLHLPILFGAAKDVYNLGEQFFNFHEIEFGLGDKLTNKKIQIENKVLANKRRSELENICDLKKPSFNSGFFIFDTEIINKRKNIINELDKLAQKYSIISVYGIQGVLNLYFKSIWKPLPSFYNFCLNIRTSPPSYRHKKIPSLVRVLHFASILPEDKSWHKENKYYPEWKKNLLLSDSKKMFLSRRQDQQTLLDFSDYDRVRFCSQLYDTKDAIENFFGDIIFQIRKLYYKVYFYLRYKVRRIVDHKTLIG